MKKVYETLDPLMIEQLKNLLENEGIHCIIKNENLARIAGSIPLSECWYEIWIDDELEFAAAEDLIKNALSDDLPSGPEWICPNCRENNENQFSACWNCGIEKP